ncbi:hypothetical protein ACFQ3J_20685 [Paenibacillus provencensis]|uniref:Uncharacterized protein n=1 Tax=Paenibacillus provencensis TaxID=441151 RepID=A0ABW3PZG8_9BACL
MSKSRFSSNDPKDIAWRVEQIKVDMLLKVSLLIRILKRLYYS